jgi:hypothetical protein
VPELTKMLAKAACDASAGPYKDFTLSDEEWEAVHVASWLHDCGKVTTPEYVVDKATKLETIYDRIHEVRMRFEVLKRDAEIACLRRIAEGGEPLRPRRARAEWKHSCGFAFVANITGRRIHGAGADRALAASSRAHLAAHARYCIGARTRKGARRASRSPLQQRRNCSPTGDHLFDGGRRTDTGGQPLGIA